jgi:CheY-like chemotaxis protein
MAQFISPRRVLLVDDDAIYRNYLRQILEEMGSTDIQEAGDGREARRLLQASATGVELIVCDVFMPEMDGMEFLEFLVRHKYRGKLTMVSNGDQTILEVARTFAVEMGLQLVGAFPKEAVTSVLLGAILKFP